ncbi:MAG: hypothetical protein U0P47_04120 [Acidimicrobiales bacterium]
MPMQFLPVSQTGYPRSKSPPSPRPLGCPTKAHLVASEEPGNHRPAGGRTNQQIGDAPQPAPKAVSDRLSSIYTKLSVADRSQAALESRSLGFGNSPNGE